MNAQYESIEAGHNDSSVYQVLVTNMFWRSDTMRSFRSKYDSKRELPKQIAFDIPVNVMSNTKDNLNDVIESYVYNTLTRKFGHELCSAQIWLPLSED